MENGDEFRGYVFGPYIPLTIHPTICEIKTKYAEQLISEDFYEKLKIDTYNKKEK